TVLRGEPSGVQVRQLGGTLGPIQPQPVANSRFGFAATTSGFYHNFVTILLEHNLRPLVAKLVEMCRAKPDVLWDSAIEALLTALDGLEADEMTLAEARQFLLVEELDPGDRALSPAQVSCNSTLAAGGILYLK